MTLDTVTLARIVGEYEQHTIWRAIFEHVRATARAPLLEAIEHSPCNCRRDRIDATAPEHLCLPAERDRQCWKARALRENRCAHDWVEVGAALGAVGGVVVEAGGAICRWCGEVRA